MKFRALLNSLPDMRSWRCVTLRAQYVIVQEKRSGPGFEDYYGFTATIKLPGENIRPLGQFDNFLKAVNSCEEEDRKLKQ